MPEPSQYVREKPLMTRKNKGTVTLMAYKKPLSISLLALFISGCAVTSQPIDAQASLQRAEQDKIAMFQNQETLAGPLTLHQAMARAVKYNLEARLKLMEEAMAERQLDLASFDLLPRITAQAGYVGRSNVSASSSESIDTGTQSLEPSTSQDQHRQVADLNMVWNVLDFGVSYLGAKQQADQRWIMQERRRKVLHTITQDVRSAYWQAVAAERLLRQIDDLLARVEQARNDSRRLQQQKLGDMVQNLTYQRSLIEATRRLEEQRRALSLAKTRLAALINLPLESDFALAAGNDYPVPELSVSLAELEQHALVHRPELREQDYQRRISANETRKAMLRLLPGLEFSAGGHYDSNSFLTNNSWADYGVKVTWNLFNVLSGPAAIDAARAGEEVANAKRQAMSMAVLAQLYVANANFQEARRQFATSSELAGLDEQIVTQLRNRHRAQAIGELELIQGELNNLQAKLRRDLAYADLRNAYAQLFVSTGADLLPDTLPDAGIDTLAQALANGEQQWQQGI